MADQGLVIAVIGRPGSLTDPEPFDVNCDFGSLPAPILFSDWGHSSIAGAMNGAAAADPPPVGNGQVEVIGGELVASGAIWLETQRGADCWALLQRLKGRTKFSVGYRILAARPPNADERSRGVKRVLTKVTILEASVVAVPVEVTTRLLEMKSDLAAVEAALRERREIAAEFAAHKALARRIRHEQFSREMAPLRQFAARHLARVKAGR